jgi:hypothetical protein
MASSPCLIKRQIRYFRKYYLPRKRLNFLRKNVMCTNIGRTAPQCCAMQNVHGIMWQKALISKESQP